VAHVRGCDSAHDDNGSTVFDKRRRTRHTLRVEQNQSGDKWAAVLVKRAGAAAKTARGSKSAAWLSDRTADLGYRISPSVIAKLDSGHRGGVLTVPELLILAAALDVPPLGLIFPDLPGGQIDVIPDRPGSSFDAYLWATGEAPSFLNPGAQAPLALLVNAVRERWAKLKDLARFNVRAGIAPDEITRKSYKALREDAEQQIERINALIPEVGGVLNDA
jgi:hypothetical protein